MHDCMVPECERQVSARGLCRPHYRRLMRSGQTGSAPIQQRRYYTSDEDARLLAIAPGAGKVRDGDMAALARSLGRGPNALACRLYELRGRRLPR